MKTFTCDQKCLLTTGPLIVLNYIDVLYTNRLNHFLYCSDKLLTDKDGVQTILEYIMHYNGDKYNVIITFDFG